MILIIFIVPIYLFITTFGGDTKNTLMLTLAIEEMIEEYQDKLVVNNLVVEEKVHAKKKNAKNKK